MVWTQLKVKQPMNKKTHNSTDAPLYGWKQQQNTTATIHRIKIPPRKLLVSSPTLPLGKLSRGSGVGCERHGKKHGKERRKWKGCTYQTRSYLSQKMGKISSSTRRKSWQACGGRRIPSKPVVWLITPLVRQIRVESSFQNGKIATEAGKL